jgi:hypothetical protein
MKRSLRVAGNSSPLEAEDQVPCLLSHLDSVRPEPLATHSFTKRYKLIPDPFDLPPNNGREMSA